MGIDRLGFPVFFNGSWIIPLPKKLITNLQVLARILAGQNDKKKEKEKLSALRDIKSKLMLEATSGNGEVSEEVAMKIVMKLHKQRMETYDLYIKEGREDLAKDEKD